MSVITSTVSHIHTWLKEGWFNPVTHNDLTNITSSLAQLRPEERNEVIKQLDDQTLRKWSSEVGETRWLVGVDQAGGFTGAEKKALYSMLAESIDTTQLARVGDSLLREDDGIATTEFKQAILEKRSPEEILALTTHFLNTPKRQLGEALMTETQQKHTQGVKYSIQKPQESGFEKPDTRVPQRIMSSLEKLIRPKLFSTETPPPAFAAQQSKTKDGLSIWDIQLNTASNPNLITVSQNNDNPDRPQINISMGSQFLTLDAASASRIRLIGTDQKQNIFIDDSVKTDLWIDARGGDDSIINNNRGYTEIDGGKGNDVMYGGGGRNILIDADGTNYFATGLGSNTIKAGGKHSTISAIDGRVDIKANADSTTVYAGSNTPDIKNNSKLKLFQAKDAFESSTDAVEMFQTSKAYSKPGLSDSQNKEDSAALKRSDKTDKPSTNKKKSLELIQTLEASSTFNLGHSIKIEGSPAFKQRINADLDLLRASPSGQQMLAALDKAFIEKGNHVTIKDCDAKIQNSYAKAADRRASTLRQPGSIFGEFNPLLPRTGIAGPGSNSEIKYNPFINEPRITKAPFVVLFHELSHAYNQVTGTLQPNKDGHNLEGHEDTSNAEPQAMGLNSNGLIYDFDGDGPEKPSTHNPLSMTEKGISLEAGLPVRMRHDGRLWTE